MLSILTYRKIFVLGLLLCAGGAVHAQSTQQVMLSPDRDTSLFEEGPLSNGGGQYLFSGVIQNGARRRALLRFPVDAIPAGSTITDVALSMNMSRSRTPTTTLDVGLHRMSVDWQAGVADAPGQEGMGVAAQTGDATWAFRSFPNDAWQQAGGDFEAAASANTLVVALGQYQWQSAGLVSDIQGWLDNPSSNFGWIAVGNEGTPGNAKRFDSSELPTANLQPQLLVTFTAPVVVTPPSSPSAIPVSGPVGLMVLMMLIGLVGASGIARAQQVGRRR